MNLYDMLLPESPYVFHDIDHGFCINTEDVFNLIEQLWLTGQWIPCSERLPEEDDYKSCIECLDGAVWYFTENGTMGLGYYYKSTKEWSTTYDLKTDGKVVAWMPLPDPYRVERRIDNANVDA